MMIVMKKGATQQDIDHIVKKLETVGAKAHISKGKYKTIIGAIGDREAIIKLPFEAFPGVETAIPILKPYKLVSREFKEEDSVISIEGLEIGGDNFTVIAGPCSVENEEQIINTAIKVKEYGAALLRGGAFKPRTSPYSFQGLGEEGLKMLALARDETGLPIVTEVLDVRDTELVTEYADVLQIGARNMQNFLLLSEAGKTNKPVLLKRGFSCTIEELLMAAEYIVKEGNSQVILCERGIRTFESATRNTFDISAIPIIKNLSHLPVIGDPSHSSGHKELIKPISLAALAAGAHGVMIEVHPNPEEALCDGPQSLHPDEFMEMMAELESVLKALNKNLVRIK